MRLVRHCNRWFSEIMGFLFSEGFKVYLDKVLSVMIELSSWSCFEQEVGLDNLQTLPT